jgi:exosortase/archaeosortase family protein
MDAHAATPQPNPASSGGRSRLPFGRPGPRLVVSWLIIAIALALALGVYSGILGGAWIDAVARWTARWSSGMLNAIGFETTVTGTILSSDSFAVNVVTECTSIGPLLLFLGAVAAHRTSLKNKLYGAGLGIVILTGVNLVRIASLFWIGSVWPQHLGIAHLLIWQSAMILLAIVLWLYWADRFADARQS